MSQESTTSDLNIRFQEAKTVKLADLPKLKDTTVSHRSYLVLMINLKRGSGSGTTDLPRKSTRPMSSGKRRQLLSTMTKLDLPKKWTTLGQ